jgi:two-component system KDP operon response regulator KdpE
LFEAREEKMAKKVLLIDDDPELGGLMEVILHSIDLEFYHSYSGPEGLKKAYEVHPDLIILDIMMPGMNGFDVCVRLREITNVPVLMLTARNSENDMLRGFNVGVDDFMKKPFNKNELIARVRALLRRSSHHNRASSSYILSYADPILEIDLDSQNVKLHGEVVELSRREFELLACLVREQGKIISRRELARELWGEPVSCSMTNSSLYIYYLRKKLQDGQHGHQYIRTLWGRGYWFEPRKEEKNMR